MNQPLDVFGQQPGLNGLYTQLCLCFPLPNTERADALHSLRTGMQRLQASVPWLAGVAVREEGTKRFMIRQAEVLPSLIIEDCSNILPSLEEFRAVGYPARLLDEKIVAPCETIRKTREDPAAVFIVQASLVEGGLLLVLCGLHSCMDMAGQAYVTLLFAKACRGETLSIAEVDAANARADDATPLLNADELAAEASKASEDIAARPPQPSTGSVKAVWSYALFSGSALSRLKAKAAETVTSGFVSTDDSLSAFLWQSITGARLPRFADGDVKTAFTRTVDARSAAGMPATYTGNAALKVACRMTVRELLGSPLGAIASLFREVLDDIGHKFRLEATLLHEGKPATKPSVEPSTGVNLSSWAKEKTYELDFGLQLGCPEAVRRPTFEAWESLVYLMPKRPDGEIAVAICLREEDTERLKGSADFAQYARFVD